MFPLIKSNIKRNFSSYLFYYLAIMLNVAVVYVFFSIPMNESIKDFFKDQAKIYSVFKFGAVVVAAFSTMFINYSLNYFVNKRVNELALYSLFGVSKRKISFIIILENLVIGFFAVITGMIMGIFFSKFVIMLLIKYLKVSLLVKNDFELQTVFFTSIFYFAVLSLSSILVFLKVYKLSLLNLFKKTIVSEGTIKGSYILGFLSIIILILGYSCGIYGVYHKDFFIQGVGGALFFSVIGTFLFFRNFMTVALDKIVGNNKMAYKNGRIIWLRRITHRMKSSYKLIAIIAILIAITLTSIGVITSLDLQSKYLNELVYKNDIAYITKDKNNDKVILDKLDKIKKENIDFISEYKIKNIKDLKNEDERFEIYFVSDKLFNDIDLKPDEMISHFVSNDYFKANEAFEIDGEKIKLKDKIDKPILTRYFLDKVFIVDDSVYQSYNSEEIIARGIKFNGIFDNLKSIIDINYELNSMSIRFDSAMRSLEIVFIFRMLIFISIIVGLIFTFSSASILYIKVVNNTISDSDSFKILSEIGFNNNDIKANIKNYAKTFYYLPLFIGVLHSSVAIIMLKLLMLENGFLYTDGVLKTFGLILLVFSIIYYIFYRITLLKSYSKIIK